MRYICDHCGKVEVEQKPPQFASFVAHRHQVLGLCGECKQGPGAEDRARVLRDYGVDWLRMLAGIG